MDNERSPPKPQQPEDRPESSWRLAAQATTLGWNLVIPIQTMDAAITNLDERVEQLQLQYHAIRQEGITREVLEVQSNTRSRRPYGMAGT